MLPPRRKHQFGKGHAFGSSECNVHESKTSRQTESAVAGFMICAQPVIWARARGLTSQSKCLEEKEGQRAEGRLHSPPQTKTKLDSIFLSATAPLSNADALGDVSRSTVLEIGPDAGSSLPCWRNVPGRLIGGRNRSRAGGSTSPQIWDDAQCRSHRSDIFPSISILCLGPKPGLGRPGMNSSRIP